jgi:hypothetical protein
LDGAPQTQVKPGNKRYDKYRKVWADYLGLEFLFCEKQFVQSVQTDSKGIKHLVNSRLNGEILAVKPVPDHVKPWFNIRMRYPNQYLGIPKLEDRRKRLSYLLHIVTQYGIPSRKVWKSLCRLSLTWYNTKFEDMRKHVKSITHEMRRVAGFSRSPWESRKDLPNIPTRVGVTIHENGFKIPFYRKVPRGKTRDEFASNSKPRVNA